MKKLKTLGGKLLRRVGLFIQNHAKPLKGAIAYAITYAAAKVGFSLDPVVSAAIAGSVFTGVVAKVGPIFGYPTVKTPKLVRQRNGVKRVR